MPHERLSITWAENEDSFALSLPWLFMEVDVSAKDKIWIKEATQHLKSAPENDNVQRFLTELRDYPLSYTQPRPLEVFEMNKLQSCPEVAVDCSTPAKLVATYGCEIAEELIEDVPLRWTWDWDKILRTSQIPGTDLYDPISFISYLICYRLEWESATWSGQDGLGQLLEALLKADEQKFFQAIGWVAKQSWYVTTNFVPRMEPALVHFSKAKSFLKTYMNDEIGHNKFMEQVFRDLSLNIDTYPVGAATKWSLDSLKRAAELSPLAFSSIINIFEAAYYEGQDPISRTLKQSSKPHAAQGFDLHYKINQEHRHCDVPLHLAHYQAPQSHAHATLTLALFELTLTFLDKMEKRLNKL